MKEGEEALELSKIRRRTKMYVKLVYRGLDGSLAQVMVHCDDVEVYEYSVTKDDLKDFEKFFNKIVYNNSSIKQYITNIDKLSGAKNSNLKKIYRVQFYTRNPEDPKDFIEQIYVFGVRENDFLPINNKYNIYIMDDNGKTISMN